MSSYKANNTMENDFTLGKKISEGISNFNNNNEKNPTLNTSGTRGGGSTDTGAGLKSTTLNINYGFKNGSNTSVNGSSPIVRKSYNSNSFKRHSHTKSRSGNGSIESISSSNNSLHKRISQNNSFSKNHNPFNTNSPLNNHKYSSNNNGSNNNNNSNNFANILSLYNKNNDEGSGSGGTSSTTSTWYNRRNSLHSKVINNQNEKGLLNNSNTDTGEGDDKNKNNKSNTDLKHSDSIVSKAKHQYETLTKNSNLSNYYQRKGSSSSTLTQKYSSATMPKSFNMGANALLNSNYNNFSSTNISNASYSNVNISNINNNNNNYSSEIKINNNKDNRKKSSIMDSGFFTKPTTSSSTAKSNNNILSSSSSQTIATSYSNANSEYIRGKRFSVSSSSSTYSKPSRLNSTDSKQLPINTTSSSSSTNPNSLHAENGAPATSSLSINEVDFSQSQSDFINSGCFNNLLSGSKTVDRRTISKLKNQWEERFHSELNFSGKEDNAKKDKLFSEIDHTTTQNTRNEWIRKVSMQGNTGTSLVPKGPGLGSSTGKVNGSYESLYDKNGDGGDNSNRKSSKLCNVFTNNDLISSNECIDMEEGFKPSMVKKMKNRGGDLKETFLDFQNNRAQSLLSINNINNNINANGVTKEEATSNRMNVASIAAMMGSTTSLVNTNSTSHSTINVNSYHNKNDNGNGKHGNSNNIIIGSSNFAANRQNFELSSSTYFQRNNNNIVHSTSYVFDHSPNSDSLSMAKRRSLNFTDYSSSNSNLYYTMTIQNKRSYRIAQLMQFFENDSNTNEKELNTFKEEIYPTTSRKNLAESKAELIKMASQTLDVGSKIDLINKSDNGKKEEESVDHQEQKDDHNNKNNVDEEENKEKEMDEMIENSCGNNDNVPDIIEEEYTNKLENEELKDEEREGVGDFQENYEYNEYDNIIEEEEEEELEEEKEEEEELREEEKEEEEELREEEKEEEEELKEEEEELNEEEKEEELEKEVKEVESRDQNQDQNQDQVQDQVQDQIQDKEENVDTKEIEKEENKEGEGDKIDILSENVEKIDEPGVEAESKNNEEEKIEEMEAEIKSGETITSQEVKNDIVTNTEAKIMNGSSLELISEEKAHLDLSIKSHSCSKLNEILDKKDNSDQTQERRNLKSTSSLPNINKDLIHEIFSSLLFSEQVKEHNIKLNSMMTFDENNYQKMKHRKYLSGMSNIKNTGYTSYDIKKPLIEPSSYSQADIMSNRNMHTLRGFLTSKNKKKKIYASIEKLFEGENSFNTNNDIKNCSSPLYIGIAIQSFNDSNDSKLKQTLKFKENDTIEIYQEKDDKYYYGKINGLSGWFPKKYVMIKPSVVEDDNSDDHPDDNPEGNNPSNDNNNNKENNNES